MTIRINLFVKGTPDQIGLRRWSLVPRIGDDMVVTVNGENVLLRVTRVVWGVTEPSRQDAEAEVSIELDKVPDSD
jgi:hypothetical protein